MATRPLGPAFVSLLCLLLLQSGCRPQGPSAATKVEGAAANGTSAHPGMVLIKGGVFAMGATDGMPDEEPIHQITVPQFWMDSHEVTVSEFSKFVAATNYITEAEKFAWSGVFDMKTGEWLKTKGASWRHPDGPKSEPNAEEPVCQISWNDATAYAKWAGKRLPTEAQWEFAARGGLVGKRYVWGDELRPGGKPVANWWQGHFPARDSGEDGYVGRAPVGKFPANDYGLYDMAGNVWEWCADWFDDEYYGHSPNTNPAGPDVGKERVLRGGSWMCSENYCTNYRPAARSHATPDSALNNLGFRCVSD